MEITTRKKIELEHKLASLRAEFEDWRRRSDEGQPLEKHHTQIRRVTWQLEGLQQQIQQRLNFPAGDEAAIVERCRQLEVLILEVHRIWDFYRSKLTLRALNDFTDYLSLADEFAWECYFAAQSKVPPTHIAPEDIKEPPLIFFNGGASPFAMPRNFSYQAEPLASGNLPVREFARVLKALPIPVIGIPWFQLQHLPDALIIGHEVGHAVAEDFRLTQSLYNLLEEKLRVASVPEARRRAWRAWADEVFADLYGGLATGPAFVGALMDFLATSRTTIVTEKRTDPHWGAYPTDFLRILLNLEALKYQGFDAECQSLKQDWQSLYPTHAMPEFEPDLKIVVEALFKNPWPELGGNTLPDVLSFSRADHDQAIKNVRVVEGNQLMQPNHVRVLLATARLTFEANPVKYQEWNTPQLILDGFKTIQQSGVRGSTTTQRPDLSRYDADGEGDRQDQKAGAQLFESLVNTLSLALEEPERPHED